MKKVFLLLILLILLSCKTSHVDYTGFWVEKERENEIVIIKKYKKNYIVEINDERYPAQIKDDLLEINTTMPIKSLIDENDILIWGGKEYIRIEKSKTYHIAKFKDCSSGDLLHIEFEGIQEDFGDANYYNNYGDYELCLEDKDGYTIPDPEYVGKEFIIRWDMKRIKVMDIENPDRTIWEERPRITFLKLKE